MVKIVVVGAKGDLGYLAPKLTRLSRKSGPFEMAVLLSPPKEAATSALSIPTYFSAGSHQNDSTPREVANNLHYVGKSAVITLRTLQFCFCTSDEEAERLSADLKTKNAEAAKVDVLITHRGPAGTERARDAVSQLGLVAKPRYHFFGTPAFHALQPFRVRGADFATRVIAVGETGRWVYAADIAPLRDMSADDRRATVPNALGDVAYLAHGTKRTGGRQSAHGGPQQKRKRGNCWFCLSNEVESHLVVSVGTRAYVALAKGGVNDSHLVVVPVAHVANSASEEVCDETVREVERLVCGIAEYYRQRKSSEAFVFEWGGGGDGDTMHMCVQAVAVRKEACGRIADACKQVAKRFGAEVGVEEGGGGMREVRRRGLRRSFWGELPGGKRVVVGLDEETRLPASFGRVLVTQALGTVDRAEWRRCVLPTRDEEALAERVRSEVSPFLGNETRL